MEFEAEVIGIRDYRDEDKVQIRIIKLRLPEGLNFTYKAGQFAMLAMDGFFLKGNLNMLKWTSYSIASSPDQKGFLEFCIKIKETGGFTQYLSDKIQLGSKLNVKGPFGNFTIENPRKNIYLLAAGSGIAPMMSMLRFSINNGNAAKITFVYGFRNNSLYPYKEEFEQYLKNPNFTFIPTQSRPDSRWQGRKGYVQDIMKVLNYPEPNETLIFICGNPVVVAENKKLLLEKGIPAENIHIEQWEGA
jgi:NAD(P)H-flavin reductase